MSDSGITYGEAAPAPRIIQPDDNGWSFSSPAGVPEDCKVSLRALLAEAKNRLLPGQPVTDGDFDRFLTWVFRDWVPGTRPQPPSKAGQFPDLPDTSCEIGTLAETCVPGPKSKQNNEAVKPHRQVGQPVYLKVDYQKGRGFSFSFRDSRSGFISKTHPVHWVLVKSEFEGYLEAMGRYDSFYYYSAHYYNIQMVHYLARCRLNYWASGGDHQTTPPNEDVEDALREFRMCYNQDYIGGIPDGCLAKLKACPERHLFNII